MPPVVKVGDQPVLVATGDYPYATWSFEKFNPIQSRVFEFYKQECNAIISAKTSGGKTVVAEQFLAHEIRERGGKGMFLAPMRALAQEKIDQWLNKSYHFKDKKVSICTGDYRLTKARSKELDEADIIIMTSEMLSHRARNYKSEQNNWLQKIGTICVDESHLLTVPGRGDHLEVGLMKFSIINPNARLVLLSATMPNVDEIGEWISYSLNQKETYVLNSQYRPVPLNIHYELYDDSSNRYEENEQEKINRAMDIVEWYKDDKFLIFVHSKTTGEMLKKSLIHVGVAAEFHHADLNKDQRTDVETRFKTDPKLRVILATPTLAWGMNLPARRVIILGVHRGLDQVEPYNITQMIGRSGRLGIDPQGDAYILIPESEHQEQRARINKPQKIESQLLNKTGDKHKVLAFHLVSEIHHGEIATTEDVQKWYKRSLAYFQSKNLDDSIAQATLSLLEKKGAIQLEGETWTARPVGKVASMFYFSPFDVSDLYNNFNNLFSNKRQDNEYALAMALGNIDTQKSNIVSKKEKAEMAAFINKIRILPDARFYTEGGVKAGFCYFNLLNGFNTAALAGIQRGLQVDFERVSQVLQSLDSLTGKWGRADWFKTLEGRIRHGVPAHLVDLCRLEGIGKVRATKLYDAGICDVTDLANANVENVKKLVNMKLETVQKILSEAKKLAF